MNLNGYPTEVKLNILPLGSYDILVGMDCLEKKKVVIDCLAKPVSCVD